MLMIADPRIQEAHRLVQRIEKQVAALSSHIAFTAIPKNRKQERRDARNIRRSA